MQSLTIDIVTFDPAHNEYALHLVEAEELPDQGNERRARLEAIQDRVLNAFDAAVDGHLGEKYPETLDQTIRIQVDSPFGKCEEIEELVNRLSSYVAETPEYASAVKNSPYARAVHFATGHELGRFQASPTTGVE